MKKLLEKISELAHQLDETQFQNTKKPWLGEDPATNEEIIQLEQGLNIKLPQDYVDLLKISREFKAAIDTEPHFVSPESVCYLRDYDSELIEIWRETGNEEIADELSQSILVAGKDDEQQFLLLPPNNNYATWRYWKFAHWIPGEEAYDDLMHYFTELSVYLDELIKEQESSEGLSTDQIEDHYNEEE